MSGSMVFIAGFAWLVLADIVQSSSVFLALMLVSISPLFFAYGIWLIAAEVLEAFDEFRDWKNSGGRFMG